MVFPESVTWSSSCFSDVYLFAISASYAIDEVHETDIDGYFRNVMNESTSFASFALAFKNQFSRLNEISRGCEKIIPVSESFSLNFKFSRMMNLNAWFWGWNVRVNGMRSVFSFWAVCDADCRSIFGRGILFLSFKRATSHVFRKTGTLSLICRRNQSHHYINDRV